MIKALQRDKKINTNFIELDGSESKGYIKVDAYEMLIYNTDVSYLPLSEMGHETMLYLK